MAEPASPWAGLCASCGHARILQNRRGSQFTLCGRSREDRRFPRYPNLPVVRCPGYERGEPETRDSEEEDP